MKDITPQELKARLDAQPPPLVLDVREDWEVALASLPGAVHIPMNEIPSRLDELDRDREIVVMCKVGGRSLQVAHYLERRGFASVANLAGGILGWSRDVDPSIPTY